MRDPRRGSDYTSELWGSGWLERAFCDATAQIAGKDEPPRTGVGAYVDAEDCGAGVPILGPSGCSSAAARNYETHVSAQTTQACSYARLQGAYAHTCGASGAQTSSRQGSYAADGVVAGSPRTAESRERSRGRRVSRSADFQRVYREGRSLGNRYLVMYTFPRDPGSGSGEARLGVSVSRRVGGAVARNRVKRVLREAFALESSAVAGALDVVVVARPEVRNLDEREGLDGVRRALAELVERSRAAPVDTAAGGRLA